MEAGARAKRAKVLEMAQGYGDAKTVAPRRPLTAAPVLGQGAFAEDLAPEVDSAVLSDNVAHVAAARDDARAFKPGALPGQVRDLLGADPLHRAEHLALRCGKVADPARQRHGAR